MAVLANSFYWSIHALQYEVAKSIKFICASKRPNISSNMIDSPLITKTLQETSDMEETITPSNASSSLDVHRHNSEMDVNQYVINYVDDTLTSSNLKSPSMDKASGPSKDNGSRLEVSQLPDEVVAILGKRLVLR